MIFASNNINNVYIFYHAAHIFFGIWIELLKDSVYVSIPQKLFIWMHNQIVKL